MVACRVTSSKQSPVPCSPKTKALLIKKSILRSKSTPKRKTNKVKLNVIVVAKKLSKSPTKSSKRQKRSPMKRAEEVQANLPSEFPSFVKLMLPSHVSGGFWLGLPKSFCISHMPKQDEKVTLVDESEEKFETKYLVEKSGLSGGWRGFSIAHDLLEGDVLVFQLHQHWILKVYILRAKGLTEIDGAISLLTLDPCSAKPLNAYHTENHIHEATMPMEKHSENYLEQEVIMEQSGDDSDGLGSEILEGITFSRSVADFKDVKCIEDFSVLVDGLIINSVMPSHLRIKYYDLCCSRSSYLHQNLLEGLNFKLTLGIISETVNIADAIRACRISSNSCRGNLSIWDKTLKAFEELGMKVGFLRERISKVLGLIAQEESREMMMIAKMAEKEKAEEEMQNMKKVIKNLGHEIDDLKNGTVIRVLFEEEANAPW